MNHTKTIAFSLIILASVSGCATKMSDVTDENSLTMKEIYNGSFNAISPLAISKEEAEYNKKHGIETGGSVQKRAIHEGPVDLRDYTRTANNEHQVLFKRIDNPILIGYVFAHLTEDDIPIPSYSIPFRMSPKDYYAMPGENQPF